MYDYDDAGPARTFWRASFTDLGYIQFLFSSRPLRAGEVEASPRNHFHLAAIERAEAGRGNLAHLTEKDQSYSQVRALICAAQIS